MGKSITTLHREIERKAAQEAYDKTPLGKAEKRLKRVYKDLEKSKKQLPEDVSKKIYDVRDENEKAQMVALEKRKVKVQNINKEHSETVDILLLASMTKELVILEKHLGIKSGFLSKLL